jgi:acyl-CoA thioesterase YciA
MPEDTPQPSRPPQLRVVAMPRDANPGGDIFGGWTLSQMDLAGGVFAAHEAKGRVATVAIDAMKFLRPITVGDEVSCYCSRIERGDTSITIKVETWARSGSAPEGEKVTEGVFTFVAIDDSGKPRQI